MPGPATTQLWAKTDVVPPCSYGVHHLLQSDFCPSFCWNPHTDSHQCSPNSSFPSSMTLLNKWMNPFSLCLSDLTPSCDYILPPPLSPTFTKSLLYSFYLNKEFPYPPSCLSQKLRNPWFSFSFLSHLLAGSVDSIVKIYFKLPMSLLCHCYYFGFNSFQLSFDSVTAS